MTGRIIGENLATQFMQRINGYFGEKQEESVSLETVKQLRRAIDVSRATFVEDNVNVIMREAVAEYQRQLIRAVAEELPRWRVEQAENRAAAELAKQERERVKRERKDKKQRRVRKKAPPEASLRGDENHRSEDHTGEDEPRTREDHHHRRRRQRSRQKRKIPDGVEVIEIDDSS
jgi:replication initiation and membrane attachment protein DnaB